MLLSSHTLFYSDSVFTDHNMAKPQRTLRELATDDVTYPVL